MSISAFRPDGRPTMLTLARACASAGGVSQEEVLGTSRTLRNVRPRQAAMYLGRLYGYNLTEVGRRFSRDHTTVLNACRRVQADLARRRSWARPILDKVDDILSGLRDRCVPQPVQEGHPGQDNGIPGTAR